MRVEVGAGITVSATANYAVSLTTKYFLKFQSGGKVCIAGPWPENFCKTEEDRFERADGTVHWLRWQIRPWYASDRTIGGIVISTEDITKRKRMAEELSRSEERFRSPGGGHR
jgi:PAS domain-containing protein